MVVPDGLSLGLSHGRGMPLQMKSTEGRHESHAAPETHHLSY